VTSFSFSISSLSSPNSVILWTISENIRLLLSALKHPLSPSGSYFGDSLAKFEYFIGNFRNTSPIDTNTLTSVFAVPLAVGTVVLAAIFRVVCGIALANDFDVFFVKFDHLCFTIKL
jgi:hypothetical protein